MKIDRRGKIVFLLSYFTIFIMLSLLLSSSYWRKIKNATREKKLPFPCCGYLTKQVYQKIATTAAQPCLVFEMNMGSSEYVICNLIY